MPGFSCCVPGCFNNNKHEMNLKYYQFPKDKKLRKLWIRNIDRRGNNGKFSIFMPTTGQRVCSEHFAGGKKTYMIKVPTIFPLKSVKPSSTPRRKLIFKGIPNDENDDFPDDKTFSDRRVHYDVSSEHSYSVSSNCPDDLVHSLKEKDKAISAMAAVIEELELKIALLESKIDEKNREADQFLIEHLSLKQRYQLTQIDLESTRKELNSKTLSITTIKDRPNAVKFYSGFSSYGEFLTLFNFLSPDLNYINYWGSKTSGNDEPTRRIRALTPKDELLLVLSRLRVGLQVEDLAYR